MATYTKVCSNNSSYTLRLELSESNVNVANNTSTITYSLYLDSTYPRFEDWNVTYTLYIGSEVSINVTERMSMPPTRKEPLLLTSGSKVVTHDSDGKKSLSVSCSVSTVTSQPYLPGSASISGQTFTLTTIARKSTLITENGKVVATIATATSIQVNRQNSAFTHTITYTFGSASSTIISKSNEISVTWTPPISLYSQMAGKSSEYGTITIETFNGATSLGSNSYPLLLEAYNSIVYQPPNISGLSFERGSGNSDDTWVANPNGGDLKVNFAASITSGIPGNRTILSVKLDSSVKYTKPDETSGDKIVYIPGIGTVTTHILIVSSKDTIGASSQWTLTVPTISVPFDINVDLPGAAFGKVAEHAKTLELAGDWELKIGGKSLADIIYPVGSVYIAFNDTNPSTLFGGTWKRIKNTFLWAVGSAGQDLGLRGGEAEHTLTASEMPSHNGHLSAGIAGTAPYEKGNYKGYLNSSTMTAYGDIGRGWNVYSGNEMHPASEAAGGGQPHNNMPPYIQVSMWRRTA